MLKFAKLFLVVLLIAGCSGEPEPKPSTPLVVKTSGGDIRFMVEVANTPEDLEIGLMNRTNLGFNSGMIFNIYPVRPTAMWMKNTKIPLDMLFVAADGSVSMIKEGAEPMSEELIISRDPVRAVVEINAGQVKRNGIKIGDKIVHALLNNTLDVKTPGPEAPAAAAAVAPAAPKAEIPVPSIKVEPKIPAIEAPAPAEAPVAEVPAAPEPQAPAALPVAPAEPKLPVPAPTF